MSARIYVEGGGVSGKIHIPLRRAFRKLFERMGMKGKMPVLIAGGGRARTFDMFKREFRTAPSDTFVAMLVDSEIPVADIEQAWVHLKNQDGWEKPADANDEQVLLMVTCMETWVVTDRQMLKSHYGSTLQESALPSLNNMETRSRDSVQDALTHATRNCRNVYSKGKRSFEVIAKLDPATLRQHLPSFVRIERILAAQL